MEKCNMHTIIGSSGTYHCAHDCALMILFQLYGSKAGLFEGNLFWVGQHDSPNLHIGRRTSPIII